ncbi:PepSY1/2 domain-containing protein [Sporosarcina trichiuri]|uniref:PepSY1/2 domain-containing protein n=1 Tax=Sporosarcina trichiuri TaxID=3056445 RepID=UPI0025B558ED|nr:PepSY1/2 domain-containing protein [Sporosarcina sp. 0.2-SM1T-5]WJY28609.1 germination protein YpeB [Sporosarcina sp. 0.2-SM1T-5]
MKRFSFLALFAIFSLSVYAYTTNIQKKDLQNALSVQYAKNIADASAKLQELDTAVKKTMLFNEGEGDLRAREDIWRLSSDIQQSVSSLPLDPHFSSVWMNYLSRLGKFAKTGPEQTEPREFHAVMDKASGNIENLSNEWAAATADMASGNLSMEEWQQRMDSEKASFDWKGLSASVQQYTESVFPLTASESDALKKKELKHIEDPAISKEQALDKFKKLFPDTADQVIDLKKSKPGSPYPFYHIRFSDQESVGYIDITEKGGHVLSFLTERPAGNGRLDAVTVQKQVEQFLKVAGYTDVVFEEVRENDTAFHFVYTRQEPLHKAKVLSDTIQIKASKEDGRIAGVNAAEYIRKEQLKDQPIVKIDWNTFFHKQVKVNREELVYAENEHGRQRLAYALTVTMEENGETGTYIVLVDTETKEVIRTEQQK